MQKKYKTIVADPPWPIGDFPAWFREDRRSAKEIEFGINPTPYKTMTLPEIERLNVGDIAADGAQLYLWTTDSFMEAALQVARAWGFEKSATLVWCKKPMGKGLGGTYPSNVEFVLFCRRVENKGWQEFGAWLRECRKKAARLGFACAAVPRLGFEGRGPLELFLETSVERLRGKAWLKGVVEE